MQPMKWKFPKIQCEGWETQLPENTELRKVSLFKKIAKIKV